MPKDVADALKKQGLWKEEYGAKPDGKTSSAGGNAGTARAAQREQGAVR
jgi:cytochrome c-type biogenesis protein CcmE